MDFGRISPLLASKFHLTKPDCTGYHLIWDAVKQDPDFFHLGTARWCLDPE